MEVKKGENVCPLCKGEGSILKVDGSATGDTDTWKRCVCSFMKLVAQRVGVDVVRAPSLRESPLYVPGEEVGGSAKVDKTRNNLFIKGWWSDLASHFKYVFTWKMGQESSYYVQITTDERLKNVWVGNESYDKRSKKERDEISTYNSLADLIGDHQLVIVRLGELTTPNRRMAGILHEALRIRQKSNLPTWLVESPDSIFGRGHFSYSEDVADYIDRMYEVVDFTVQKDGPVQPRGVEGSQYLDEDGMSMDGGTREVEMPTARFKVTVEGTSASDVTIMREVMGGPSHKKKTGWKKRRNDDDGGADV